MGEQISTDRCPSLGDLVAAADGGLSPSQNATMTMHLRQCATCRDRLHQANAFIEASADVAFADDAVVSDAFGDGLVSVSGAGAMAIGLDELGSEYDSAEKAEARFQEFTRRLHKQKQDVIHRQSVSRVRQWLPVAALIPLLIVGLTFSRMQTVVRAEELLSRAAKYQRALPADYAQRVRISLTTGIPAFAPLPSGPRTVAPRVPPFLAVRDVTGGVALDAWPDAAEANGAHAALAAMLARHGFKSHQPLSLAGVHAWRATPGEKHDEVFINGELFVLRTTTSVGDLREVVLTVRRHDYHVVKLALAFEGIGRLEIAEIASSTQRAANAVSPIAPLASSPVGMTGTTSPAPTPASRAAAGMTATSATSVAPLAGRPVTTQAGLSRWLDRTFGTRPERKTFVPDLQRLVGQIRQQLATLDTLARRYPETEVVEQWNNADRAALYRRVDEAYGAISRDLNELDARIGILFGSTDRALPVADAPPDWRRRAALALTHAEAMDRDVRQLLTFEDVPSAQPRAAGAASAGGAGAAPVLSTFGALWDVVHAPAGGPEVR